MQMNMCIIYTYIFNKNVVLEFTYFIYDIYKIKIKTSILSRIHFLIIYGFQKNNSDHWHVLLKAGLETVQNEIYWTALYYVG